MELTNASLENLVVQKSSTSQMELFTTDTAIQLQAMVGPTGSPVGTSDWVDAANAALLTSERTSTTLEVDSVTMSNIKTTLMASIISARGFLNATVSNVVASKVDMTGHDQYLNLQ